jgi:hypothetical protein
MATFSTFRAELVGVNFLEVESVEETSFAGIRVGAASDYVGG